MTGSPVFGQVNLVVSEMGATLAFYRLLGLDLAADAGAEWPPGSGARHAEVVMASGVRLEFDNAEMAALWHGGRSRPGAGPGGPVLGFALPSAEDVERRYAALLAAGHDGRQPPYDAFWGGRYAVVADPDGHECGLMGPDDPARAYLPAP